MQFRSLPFGRSGGHGLTNDASDVRGGSSDRAPPRGSDRAARGRFRARLLDPCFRAVAISQMGQRSHLSHRHALPKIGAEHISNGTPTSFWILWNGRPTVAV